MKAIGGNCEAIDNTAILHVAGSGNITPNLNDNNDLHLVNKKYDLADREPVHSDHDYTDMQNVVNISIYKEQVIGYIAGYVVRAIKKKLNCPQCDEALTGNIKTLLVSRMDRGGLVHASADVISVCQCVEICIQRLLIITQGGLPHATGIASAISAEVLSMSVQKGAFSNLYNHMFDTSPDYNHVFILIKLISSSYINLRMHHLAKQANSTISGIKVRKAFNKLVLFKHQ